MANLNKGIDVDAYNSFRDKAREDLTRADRHKTAVARWVQGEETRVVIGDSEVSLGADDAPSAMEMLLTSLAGCDAGMVAVRASLMGIKVNSVTAEAHGHYNPAGYVGVDDVPGPGYDEITIKVYIDAPDATPEQIAQLKHLAETVSPVGDTLTRAVQIETDVVATSEKADA